MIRDSRGYNLDDRISTPMGSTNFLYTPIVKCATALMKRLHIDDAFLIGLPVDFFGLLMFPHDRR
jgi:hypothetical protein